MLCNKQEEVWGPVLLLSGGMWRAPSISRMLTLPVRWEGL